MGRSGRGERERGVAEREGGGAVDGRARWVIGQLTYPIRHQHTSVPYNTCCRRLDCLSYGIQVKVSDGNGSIEVFAIQSVTDSSLGPPP